MMIIKTGFVLFIFLVLIFFGLLNHQQYHNHHITARSDHEDATRRRLLRCPELLGLCQKAAKALRAKEERAEVAAERERERQRRGREEAAAARAAALEAREAAAAEARRQEDVRAAAERVVAQREATRRFRQMMRRARFKDLDRLHGTLAVAHTKDEFGDCE